MKPILKISLVFFIALLLTPGALKSAHIFAGHQHFFCDHSTESHIHQKNAECDLLSLHQQLFPGLDLFTFEFPVLEEYCYTPRYFQSFIFDRHYSNISVRGPPEVA